MSSSVVIKPKSVCAQESHKHLDEYAELEAEILRDMEQEQAHKNCRRRLAVSLFPRRHIIYIAHTDVRFTSRNVEIMKN